jgi:Raf kinase inhibitor-like YbhB/YbcL family protein
MPRPLSTLGIAALLGLCVVVAFSINYSDSTVVDFGIPVALAVGSFKLVSPAFGDGAVIPLKYGCGPERDYRKPSIPLTWTDPPAGTKSFVLLVDDPHPVAKYWVHWLVTDIPIDVGNLPESASGSQMPQGAKELKNTWGQLGYGGPCPPAGNHNYRFRLFARAEEKTQLNFNGKRGNAIADMLSDSLGMAEYTGKFPG